MALKMLRNAKSQATNKEWDKIVEACHKLKTPEVLNIFMKVAGELGSAAELLKARMWKRSTSARSPLSSRWTTWRHGTCRPAFLDGHRQPLMGIGDDTVQRLRGSAWGLQVGYQELPEQVPASNKHYGTSDRCLRQRGK